MRFINYYLLLMILVLCALCVLCGRNYGETAMMHSFNRGVLTPKLAARSDVKLHYSGCRELDNFYCQVWGGASKRPGTYYIAEAADNDTAARLISFSHSTDRNYVLEFGEKTIQFNLGD